jgi:hypothetical protein
MLRIAPASPYRQPHSGIEDYELKVRITAVARTKPSGFKSFVCTVVCYRCGHVLNRLLTFIICLLVLFFR